MEQCQGWVKWSAGGVEMPGHRVGVRGSGMSGRVDPESRGEAGIRRSIVGRGK
jgi:hypothetical protein